jgi:hypothetical protein
MGSEVLTPPPPRSRPVARAVLMLVVIGLAAWGLSVRMSADDPEQPAAAPSPGPASAGSEPLTLGPPPWVRYPTPLEGRWVGAGPSGRFTLVIRNAYVDLWQGVGQSQGRPSNRRVMVMVAERVYLWPPGDRDAVATYRWRIVGDRLSFELLEQSPSATATLAGLRFVRER